MIDKNKGGNPVDSAAEELHSGHSGRIAIGDAYRRRQDLFRPEFIFLAFSFFFSISEDEKEEEEEKKGRASTSGRRIRK